MAYQFLISLRESNPIVSRRMIVPSAYTFYQFHLAIQGAMGWENCHLFQFSKEGMYDNASIGIPNPETDVAPTRDAREVLISSIFKKAGSRYTYVYDFGDEWNHDLLLEAITPEPFYRPFCMEATGACPPEDVGSLSGYAHMVEALANPKHPEHKSFRTWIGLEKKEIWDPGFASTREINKRLALLEMEEA